MSQYYADIQGNRGQATRMGTKSSGINGHIRGWNIGAKVDIQFNDEIGKDVVTVWKTSGSNGRHSSVLIAQFDSDSFNTNGAD